MIKSPEKQYNAYRVLKVLSNQDYLAIDYHGRYYLLSPLKNRRTAMLRPTSKQSTIQQGSRVIRPKECIQLDHLHYYVFPTDTAEVTCANAVDANRFNSEEHLLQFFTAAVRGILRVLLMRQAKEVRKIIDIKNAIVSRGCLYLLQLDRGKIYPRSIERSQRLGQKKDDTLRKILDNEFKIIKYFGLLLWEIIYKTCLVPKTVSSGQTSIVTKLLVSMINKEITFEYLEIKLRDEEERVVGSKEKKGKKFNFLVRNDNRYYTESMNSSNRKTNDRRVDTSGCSRESLKPCFTRKQRVISQIKTGVQAIHSFSRRIVPQFNLSKLKWASTYQSIDNRSTFRSSNTKINEKLAKQTEQAKNKFRKFLDARFTLREESDEINEGLRSKLMSKIERFKTEHRSQSHQSQQRPYSFSQNKMEQHYLGHDIEPKKLDFGTEKKDVQVLQNSQVNINENIELNEEMVKYINNQTEYVKDKQNQPNEPPKEKQEKAQAQTKETPTVSNPPPDTKAEEMSIQFQQINFKNPANPLPAKQQDSYRKLDSDVAVTQQTVMKQDKTQQYLKRKKLISENTANQSDEIEVIKLEKSIPIKSENNPPHPPAPVKKKSEKMEQISSRQLQLSIDQYEQLIGILGHICSKAKLSQSLGAVTWQKPVYFLFQRFLFEREKFEEALTLGARQITRDPKSIKDQEWDLWLVSLHRKQLIPKIAAQNRQIKQAFNAFAARIVKEVKFDRKIEFYIRNRDKNSNAKGIKFRESLSKLTISFVTEIYDTIIDERINSKEVFHFFLDILYGALIICELDSLLTPDQRVILSNYEKYTYSLDQLNPLIDSIYSLYFQEQQ